MEKLTLDNIAPYLPYALYGFAEGRKRADKLLGVYGTGGHSLTMCCRVNNHNTVDYDCNIEDFKPILRPMDLTKPIIVEGKEIIPYKELGYEYFCGEFGIIEHAEYGESPRYVANPLDYLWQIQWLFKHKFDVFGLIEKGLAIDVNTLEINPYN